MMVPFILLSLGIVLTAVVKMSLMPIKMALTYAAVWGVVACLSTNFFAGVSRQQLFAVLDMEEVITFEFIELMIMFVYIFSVRTWEKILALYPGLMLIVPVCAVSFILARYFPGMDFTLSGIISGCIVFFSVAAAVFVLRYAWMDKRSLYTVSLSVALLNIIIYGLL